MAIMTVADLEVAAVNAGASSKSKDQEAGCAQANTDAAHSTMSNTDEGSPAKNGSVSSESCREEGRYPTSTHRDATNVFLDAAGDNISLSEVQSVDVQVRDLSVTIHAPPTAMQRFKLARLPDGHQLEGKQILSSVSASFPVGTLTAILGGSGSGKTSMLNVLAGRMHSASLDIEGAVLFNGHPGVSTIRAAYVLQQDALLPDLTVRETLQYAADLRLPSPTTAIERRRVVEGVIMELGLKECADTRIGSTLHKGCSGGEKRRTSIGVQLLSNPSVLFLDEPTTGLDATSAFQLVRTLRSLARKGRTVITTIHQPRSEIWGMFDRLVLLTQGSPLYSGPAAKSLQWFANLNMPLPPFVNPAEFLIDIASYDNRSAELEATSARKLESLKVAWLEESNRAFKRDEKQVVAFGTRPEVPKFARKHAPFVRQTRILTARTLITSYRDPFGMLGFLFQALIVGLVTGLVFISLGRDLAGIRSRQGALYSAAALEGYLVLLFENYRLVNEMAVFDREHSEGVVGIIPFLLSRRLAKFVTEDIWVPLVYALPFYFMAGFRAEASTFLIFYAVVLLLHFIAVTLALCCVGTSRNLETATLIANLAYTIQTFSCGYFIQADQIPAWLRWVKWTAYCFYSFTALVTNEFRGQFYECPYPGGDKNPDCAPYTGAFIMKSLALPSQDFLITPILALVGYVVAFSIIGGLLLRFLRVEMDVTRTVNSSADLSSGKEELQRSGSEARPVDIRLDKFAVNLHKRDHAGRKQPTKPILHPVTANFPSGVLNIIMGPSGSGKTTLLNAVALRLRDSAFTQYRCLGDMTFNGAVPSDEVVRSVCSYVCQDDDALLPSLTVRETLQFAAKLRLPSFMTNDQKIHRAESILLRMGLKDCADNIIGSDLIKGISGGEKRRVTIAVQILTEPRVLVLDEPTSGLDAFTASSIMEVLSGLAKEGRTVILTIHQSRSNLFKTFGNILLLARGGLPVFSGGAAEMLAHFEALGFACPTTTNPADFALDLITVDLQGSDREEASRTKVKRLTDSWTSSHAQDAVNPATISTPAELSSYLRKPTSFLVAFPVLVHRAAINFWRQKMIYANRFVQVLSLAVVIALYFSPLQNNFNSIQTRFGFIQEFGALYFVGVLQNLVIYPLERDVFVREYDDGAYGVEAFLAQYITLELPAEIFASLLLAILTDMPTGWPRTPQLFFVLFFNSFCMVSCGESLGILNHTIFSHEGFAVNFTLLILSVAQFMGGILSIHMNAVLQAFNYLSPVRYCIRSIAGYALASIEFTCDDTQKAPDGNCIVGSGTQALQLLGFDESPLLNLIGVGVCAVVYRLLAYAVLKAKLTHWSETKLARKFGNRFGNEGSQQRREKTSVG